MRESVEHQAILEGVDLSTFQLFVEYAYTGLYRIPSKYTEKDEPCPRLDISCNVCGHPQDWLQEFTSLGIHGFCSSEVCYHAGTQKGRYRSCDCGRGSIDKKTGKREECYCPLAFGRRKYDIPGRAHAELKQHLATLVPADSVSERLVCHAQLYILADKYMVEPLKKLCLHKLHRDLLHMQNSAEGIAEVVNLLEFVDDNPEVNTVEDKADEVPPLRELIIAYMASDAKVLFANASFKAILTEHSTVAVEIAAYLAGRLEARDGPVMAN